MKELEEQKKREEELKLQWGGVGFEVVNHDERKVLDGGSVQFFRPPETNDNLITFERNEIKPEKVDVPRIPSPVLRETSVVRRSLEVLTYVEPPTAEPIAPASARTSRVQPISDGDEEMTQPKVLYAPLQESPIEREIRISAEREEALRKLRGLPALLTLDELDHGRTSVEYSIPNRPTPRAVGEERGVGDGGGDVTMKKFAESRLQVELKKEKERELALQRQGSIATISEVRIGIVLSAGLPDGHILAVPCLRIHFAIS